MGIEAARIYAVVGANLAGLESGLARASTMVDGWAARTNSVGSRLTKTGEKFTKSLTLPMAAIGVAATKMALDFQQNMELIRTQAGASQKEVDNMSKAVLELAKTSAQGPNQLAEGLYHIESLGLRGAKALGVLKQASKASMLGMANLEETTSALGGAVRTGIKGTENYSRAMGLLDATIGQGNMRMQDMVDALGTGILPTAKLAGLTLRDIGASMAIFTDENMNANMAMTRLRTALMMMQAPSKKGEEAMNALGFSSQELGVRIRSGANGWQEAIKFIHDKYDEFVKKMVRSGETLKQAQTDAFGTLAHAFGGSKTASTVMLLVNQAGLLQTKWDRIGKQAGKFNANVAASSETAANKMKIAWSNVQAALIKLGGAFLPVAAGMMQGIARLANAFDSLSPGVKKAIGYVGLFLAALGPIMFVAGNVMKAVSAMSTIVVTAFKLMAGAVSVLGVAFDFLAANPVVAIVLGLAALGVALVVAYKKSQTFREFVQAAFGVVKTVVSSVSNFVSVTVPAAFEHVLSWVRGNWPVIATLVSGPFAPIVALATNAFGVRSALVGAFGAMKSAASGIVHDIVGFFSGMPGAIGNALVNAAKTGAGLVTKAIHSIFGGLPGFVKDVLDIHSPSRVFMDIGAQIIHGAVKGIENNAHRLKDAAVGAFNKIKHIGVSGWDALKGLTSGALHAAGGLLHGGAATPSGNNQSLGLQMMVASGWNRSQWPALQALWTRESGWSNMAYNASSGATGIPQALPYTKMPRAAWLPSQGGQANPGAQIGWGLGYIRSRYGSPDAAWAHETAYGWYDKGGSLPTGWTLAKNTTGHAETVMPVTPDAMWREIKKAGDGWVQVKAATKKANDGWKQLNTTVQASTLKQTALSQANAASVIFGIAGWAHSFNASQMAATETTKAAVDNTTSAVNSVDSTVTDSNGILQQIADSVAPLAQDLQDILSAIQGGALGGHASRSSSSGSSSSGGWVQVKGSGGGGGGNAGGWVQVKPKGDGWVEIMPRGVSPGGGALVKAMARGGIVNGPTLAMLGERGREAVVPLPAGGFGGGGPEVIQVVLDRRVIAEAVRKQGLRTKKANGGSYGLG